MDSLKKRYSYKLITNFVGFSISMITAGIVPRALGVENFGVFNYITTIFRQILDFLDARTSTCFYVNLSQNPNEKNIYLFYSRYIVYAGFVFLVIISICAFTPVHNFLLKGHSSTIFYVAAGYCFFTWVSEIIIYIMDAHGYTVTLEKIRFANKILSTAILLLLFANNTINLTTYFIYLYGILFVLIISLIIYLIKIGTFPSSFWASGKGDLKKYSGTFLKYSFPMLGYMGICTLLTVAERWMLQHFGGSHEQGIYSFSYTFMNFSYLFLTAIQPLVMREISVAFSQNNILRIGDLYHKTYPLLFAITAFICAYIFIEAESIVSFFGGTAYKSSVISLRIFMINPLIYVFSGMNTSILFATNRTKLLFKMVICFVPINIVLLFILLSPSMLHLGALGYVIKNNFMELISVIIILFYLSKKIKINAFKCIFHFLYIIPFLFGSFAASKISNLLCLNIHPVGHFLISGFIYSIIIGGIAYTIPRCLGFSENPIKLIAIKIQEMVRTKLQS